MKSSSSSPSTLKAPSSTSTTNTKFIRHTLYYGYGLYHTTNSNTFFGANNSISGIGFHNRQQCHVTRAIQTLARTQTTFQRYFYSRRHFPKVLAACMTFGGFAGFTIMEYMARAKLEEKRRIYVEAYHYNGRDDTEIVEDFDNIANDPSRMTATASSASALARKITHKIVDVVQPFVREGSSAVLNRQVTKFW
ncbi:hypothetical protein ACHAXS_005210 [Conticribra weissflogii]